MLKVNTGYWLLLMVATARERSLSPCSRHGFSVLSETAIFQYKCDNFYHPEADGGINIKDESLGIDWRIPVEKAILSDKDLKYACLKDAELDFDINDLLY